LSRPPWSITGALSRSRELDQQAHAVRGPCRAIGDDHRLGGGDQHVGDAVDRGRIGAGRRDRRHPAGGQSGPIGDIGFLQVRIAYQEHRAVRRRCRDLHAAQEGFAIMGEAHRRIVPLHIIAHEGAQVGGAVQPFDAWALLECVLFVATGLPSTAQRFGPARSPLSWPRLWQAPQR